jgi:hypothetical protein
MTSRKFLSGRAINTEHLEERHVGLVFSQWDWRTGTSPDIPCLRYQEASLKTSEFRIFIALNPPPNCPFQSIDELDGVVGAPYSPRVVVTFRILAVSIFPS